MARIGRLLLLVSITTVLVMTLIGCAPSSFKLTATCSPEAAGTINPSSGTYDKGVAVEVTASPATGYRFDHWEGSASGQSSTVSLTMDSTKKLTAFFTKTYTVSVSSTPANSGSVGPSGGTYDEGQEVTLIATPAPYYKFNGWGGDASGTSDHVTITMDSNKVIVASFVKLTYTIQTQVDSSVGGTVDPVSGTPEAGTSVTITATPSSGYRFNHWGGSATGTSNPLSLLVDGDKTIIAYFTKTYTLIVSGSPSGSCTIDPSSGVHDAGTVVTLTATALFPYGFNNWSSTDNDAINPTTVIMNGDKSPVAYFRELTPGTQQSVAVNLAGYDYRIPIVLGAGQWVQGAFIKIGYDPVGINVRILDPASAIMGADVDPQSFTFQATHGAGTYYVDIYQNYTMANTHYTFNYSIYS